eukprot:Opistho-2@60353
MISGGAKHLATCIQRRALPALRMSLSACLFQRPFSGGAQASMAQGRTPLRPQSTVTLEDILLAKIKLNGPVSVSDYMREALTNPLHGYYMHRDVFGQKGDFTTSPEISQVFGEVGIMCVDVRSFSEYVILSTPTPTTCCGGGICVCVYVAPQLIGAWNVAHWHQLGSPSAVKIVEFGPGRGTLAADMLRVMEQFGMATAAELHLVEASPHLRKIQSESLGCSGCDSHTPAGVKVSWHDTFATVPRGDPLFIMAHEFFDAMPVHQFEKTEDGWRERFISADINPNRTRALNFVRAEGTTLASLAFVPRALGTADQQTTRATGATGDVLEFAPASWTLMESIGAAIHQSGGVALVIDYGADGTTGSGDTLRGYADHKQVHPLDNPGRIDITADVNFLHLKRSLVPLDGKVKSYGPIRQGDFLLSLGLEARVNQLLRVCKNSEMAKSIIDGCRKLVDPNDMGARFKVFAVAPSSATPPPAF